MADEIDISRADLSRDEQTILLRGGVEQWNAWRQAHPDVRPDLFGADLEGARLGDANLSLALLERANLRGAHLPDAGLSHADLLGAHLEGAALTGANLEQADLTMAHLEGADLRVALLEEARLRSARLQGADLSEADLEGADLTWANLEGVNLTDANLRKTSLIGTSLVNATLDGCLVFGASVWDVQLEGALQRNLCFTDWNAPTLTVDGLLVAHMLCLALYTPELQAIVDTFTSAIVLLLGRFSDTREPALDALCAALRRRPNRYIPVVFDAPTHHSQPVLDPLKTLANLSRFVVVDLTDPNMVRSELTYITANVPTVPIQPLIEGDASLPTEYATWREYRSFLREYRYTDLQQLLASLNDAVIAPVEQHVQARRLTDPS